MYYSSHTTRLTDSHDVDCGNSISIYNVHYDLKGVILHTGDIVQTGEGHYISLTRNSLSGSWNVIPQPRNITISQANQNKHIFYYLRGSKNKKSNKNIKSNSKINKNKSKSNSNKNIKNNKNNRNKNN